MQCFIYRWEIAGQPPFNCASPQIEKKEIQFRPPFLINWPSKSTILPLNRCPLGQVVLLLVLLLYRPKWAVRTRKKAGRRVQLIQFRRRNVVVYRNGICLSRRRCSSFWWHESVGCIAKRTFLCVPCRWWLVETDSGTIQWGLYSHSLVVIRLPNLIQGQWNREGHTGGVMEVNLSLWLTF